MRPRIKITKAELVSSPDTKRQILLSEARELELKGHRITRPTVRRRSSAFFISAPRGCDMHLTLSEGTL